MGSGTILPLRLFLLGDARRRSDLFVLVADLGELRDLFDLLHLFHFDHVHVERFGLVERRVVVPPESLPGRSGDRNARGGAGGGRTWRFFGC